MLDPAHQQRNVSNPSPDMDPVFVIGYPRSGTTLLLHLLMSSGEFPTYSFTESHFFSHYYKRFGPLSRDKNRERFLKELSSRDWFSGSGTTLEELTTAVDGKGDTYEAYFACFMDSIARRQDKTRWLEKTPWHMLYVQEIRKTFPRAKFLMVVRDPRDVILSIGKYGWTTGMLSGPLRTAIAWQWHMRLLAQEFDADSSDCLVIRYEDIVTDTKGTLERINPFLGLDISLQRLNEQSLGVLSSSNSSFGDSARGITSAPIGRWREKMSADLVPQVNFLLKDLLEQYGYATKGAFTPPPPYSVRLRLGMMTRLYALGKSGRRMLFPVVRR